MNGLEKLMDDLNNLPEDYIILVETSPENAFELSTALVKYMTNRNNSKGIIVSANRPYTNLMNIYRKNNIDVSKMFVLDCISKNQNAEVEADNVAFMENVSALTDISLFIAERLRETNGKKFVFFDSITTMLIHNKPKIFARFVHNILTKMRLHETGGLLISIHDETNREIRAEIAQLCDKVIKI